MYNKYKEVEGYKTKDLGKSILTLNQKIFFMCLLVFVFGLGFGAKASAATYYMKQGGTAADIAHATSCDSAMTVPMHNANTGSVLKSGDTIEFCDTGVVDFDIDADTVNHPPIRPPSNGLTYQPNETSDIVIDGTNAPSTCFSEASGFYINSKTDITIRAASGTLTIQNIGATNCRYNNSDASGIHFNGASSGTLNGLTLSASADQNVQMKGDTTHYPIVTMANCTVTDARDDGVSVHVGRITVTGGTIDNNSSGIIDLVDGHIEIAGTILTNNGTGVEFMGTNDVADNLYINVNSGQAGVSFYTATNATLKNTTINMLSADTTPKGIFASGVGSTGIIQDVTIITDAGLSKKGNAIYVQSGATLTFVGSNSVANCNLGVYHNSIVATEYTNLTITGCSIGVQQGGGSPTVYGVSFVNNSAAIVPSSTIGLVSHNLIGIAASGTGVSLTGASVTGNRLYNNIFYGTGTKTGTGILGNNAAQSTTINNNVFYNLNNGINASAGTYNGATNDFYGNNSVTAGTATYNDAGRLVSNPTFISASNFHLQSASPLIDAGTPVSLTTDYAGTNKIYGLPDIGAYEYQPTHDMDKATPDQPQIGEAIRIYGDGKFRNTVDDSESNDTDTAKLSIVPQDSDTTKWIDLNITTWNTSGDRRKTWTENGDNLEEGDEIVNTLHIVGDLVSGQAYAVRVDDALATSTITGANCTSGVCTADENGKITFTYTGGYSEHTFDVKDQTAPAVNIISPETGDTVSADDTIAFTDSEATSPKCSLNNTDWTDCQSLVTNFNDLMGWDAIAEKDTFTLYLQDTDSANNTGTDQVDNLIKADTQAPIRSDGAPSGELSSGTTSTTLSLKTEENAICRYDTEAGTDYDDMGALTTTGEKDHAQTVSGLASGNSYTYYVRCKDGSNNINDTDYLISFSVTQASGNDEDEDTDEKDINIRKVKYTATQNSITLTWKTDHNAKSTVRYGTSKGLTEKKKDNKNEKSHKVTLKNLLPDTLYYFRIKSEDGDDNADKSKIHSIKTLAASNTNQNLNNVTVATTVMPAYLGDAKPNVCSYTVQSGDSLWSIAQTVYGNGAAYSLIIEKNKEKYPAIGSRLTAGQEFSFGCESEFNGATVQGITDTKNDSGNTSEIKNQSSSSISEFKWWNPFSWF